MRYFITASLVLWTSMAHTYEIEAQTEFSVEGATSTLSIISTTDTAVFTPVISNFQVANPQINVTYTAVSSSQINTAIVEDNAQFDIANKIGERRLCTSF